MDLEEPPFRLACQRRLKIGIRICGVVRKHHPGNHREQFQRGLKLVMADVVAITMHELECTRLVKHVFAPIDIREQRKGDVPSKSGPAKFQRL